MTTPTAAAAIAPGTRSAAVAGGTNPPVATATQAAAEQFESFFLSQSLESMFAGVDTNSLFGGGQGESVYRSLLIQEYGKIAARSGGFGIADAVQRQMLQQQEVK
ncbi:MAG: rod-binding protein [Alphaproteobacteria bacterium]|nr:rod-binding protein [Alphaproteobacteria bacterium]